ncbi:MAG TPA: 2Fe-2S iron-sulfur cluster-binding protein [Solimonas sp.]
MKVTFVQADGEERTIDNIAPGTPLMNAARDHGVAGILGDCGGSCACGTCHVHVAPEWQAAVGDADDVELAALDMVAHVQQANSRLCCQISAREELDGLRLIVVPAI